MVLDAVAELFGAGGGGASGGLPSIKRQIEVAGKALKESIDEHLERVTVIDRLAMPDTFELVFRDPGHEVLKEAGLEIGAKVKVTTTSPNDESPKALISGEVTSIEADYDPSGSRAVVRGYDLSHRLSAGRKTRTFQNVKLSDVAEQIAGDAGLQPDVDDSGSTVDHLIQPNLSDLEFLYQLARSAGFDCRVDDDKLLFKKPTPSSEAPAKGDLESTKAKQLVWSKNLLDFRARMSAVAQVSEVKVRGWDVSAKEAIIGQADAVVTHSKISMSPADLAGKVGGETLVVVDHPVDDQGAADDLAGAVAEQVGSAAFEATAVVVGSPELKAGVAVSIANVDKALEGEWVISTARHEFGDGPYRTELEFTGRQDRSLQGLVAGGLPGTSGRGSIRGIVIGVVTDNEDPDDMGRVKVAYPWLSDDAESFWARLAMPGAGPDYGMVWIPQVGDEVAVAFEHGNISRPIVLGGLWNGEDAAPLGDSLFDGGDVKRSGFISRAGHKLVFFDSDDKSGVAIMTEDKKLRIALNETKGELHVAFDGKLTIDGTGDVQIKTQGAIKIEAGSTLDLKASGKTTVKGATVALNPPG
jgi:uncharacterized protein involved in type VI secretion and phage assembly